MTLVDSSSPKVILQLELIFYESKRIYPDLVVKRMLESHDDSADEKWDLCVIDTKWKLISPSNPSDNDLKQMYVYNLYWDSPKSILLYPKMVTNKDGRFGTFHKGRLEGENKCKIGFVNVLDPEGKLNAGIAEEVLKKLKG
jgi:5-methylcytosine-specific restriction enzyme subunit McrC